MIRAYAWCTEKKIIFLDCIACRWCQNISIKQFCKPANRWPNFSCLLHISLHIIHSVSFIIPCAVYMHLAEMHKPLFSQKGLPRMKVYIKCTFGTVCHKCMMCQWLYKVAAYVKSGTGVVEMSPGSDRDPCVSPKSILHYRNSTVTRKLKRIVFHWPPSAPLFTSCRLLILCESACICKIRREHVYIYIYIY